jgi:hypothetical protein
MGKGTQLDTDFKSYRQVFICQRKIKTSNGENGSNYKQTGVNWNAVGINLKWKGFGTMGVHKHAAANGFGHACNDKELGCSGSQEWNQKSFWCLVKMLRRESLVFFTQA